MQSQIVTASKMELLENQTPARVDKIGSRIRTIRGRKVILDFDLADDVPTKILNKAVGRNQARFPADFMFQLTRDEFENLKF
jgi:hypothetical protein